MRNREGTSSARERFALRVDSAQMLPEGALVGEGLATRVAAVGPLARVAAHVFS